MFAISGPRVLHKCYKILRLCLVEFSNIPDIKNLNLVRTVEKTIDTTTSIFIDSPIHVKVQPIDVNDLSAHNKLTMMLYSQGKDTNDFQLKQTSKRLDLLCNKKTSPDKDDVCLIRIPYKLKLHVTTTENASVHLAKLEADEFIVKTQKGDVMVADMKADNLKVESESGDLETEGRLQASLIELKTGVNGNVKCNNIMANNFTVATHGGEISVKSCYSDQSHFTTLMGNIRLDNLHRAVKIDVIQKGNLHITGFYGSLEASLKSGEVFMHASKFTDKSSIFIHEKGKVEVMIPNILKNLPAASLMAEKINVDEKIMKLGRFMDDSHPQRFRYEKNNKNELHIVCRNGSIDLKETDIPFFILSN
ncbi:uncharacterized protein LOC121740525 [Aricia agestis]|uniref:uncharacterized protein LOC121740525 n=1 Tax=Aricia agestis TaxID=91739 RepID=UPI001C201A47|nr:uncharacterized protein LOC121740525 [Aricia agestis]